jgi:hypothetical protein
LPRASQKELNPVRSPVRRSLSAALFLTLGLTASASGAAPTVYLSPSGSDAAACTQAAPCRTFDRGYRVASAGSEVILAAGSYGSQSLSNEPVKSSSEKVLFRPADGASVTTGSLTISNSDNIEVRDVTTGGWGVTNGSAHVILRRIVATDLNFAAGYFSGSDDVQLIDSEIARIDPDDGIHMNNGGGPNTNITIDGLFMHDLTINRDTTSHDDCIQTGDVTNLVIRNSRFVNCGTQGVFLNPYNGGATKNILIENNFFGQAQLGYNVLYVGDAVGVTIRNNSFVGQVYSYNPASFTQMKMTNNIFAGNDSYNCGQLATKSVLFSNNASTTSCSGAVSHTVNANLGSQFVNSSGSNAATFDLHLKAGAAAIDKGGSEFATVDFDGTSRPSGNAPDIGGDEFGSGTPPPPPPADTTAPTTTISSGTSGSTTATTASFSFTGSDETTAAGSLTYDCSLDGAAYAACTSPKGYSGVAVGSHTFSVRAKDAAGNVDATPASQSWTVTAPPPPPADTTAPTTTLSSATSGSTTATTASFTFTGADETTATGSLTYDCSFDGAVFSACTSPKSYSGVAVGNHTFEVRARDAAGNVDATPAASAWTVTTATPPADTTAPTTSVTSTPANPTTSTSAAFAFTGADDVTATGALTFQCSLDNAAYGTCASPKTYTGLAVGAHNVRIRARDAAGNVDASAASFTWTIAAPDTTAPETTITDQPPALSLSTDAQFAFSASDNVTAASALAFQCRLDAGAWAPCTSPATYHGLALLGHTFSVRASDAAGNVDASPATFSWTVLAPELPDVSLPTAPDAALPAAPVPAPEPTPIPETPNPPTATAPQVALTTPSLGSTFTRTVSAAANASAPTGATIKRVEFWVDGQRVGKDLTAPYRTSWSAPSTLALGVHTLSARAYDTAGRIASTAMTITRLARTSSTAAKQARTSLQLTASAAAAGGTDLAGAARSDAPVVATLAPCSSKGVAKRVKVTLRPNDGQLAGHAGAARLCVVELLPA